MDGRFTTPSVVAFEVPPANATAVGAAAAALRATLPDRTLHDAKRLIGRNLSDPLVSAEALHLPFPLVADRYGAAAVRLPSGRVVTPVQAGAALLAHLKGAAERSRGALPHALGFRFAQATISVPVAFTRAQRAATLAAGKAAGFRLTRLLEEPVAAALAHGLAQGGGERTVLVYDMGGGTLDVAVLRLEARSRTFLVMATAGDAHLGGEDFDRALAVRLAEAAGARHPLTPRRRGRWPGRRKRSLPAPAAATVPPCWWRRRRPSAG